MTQRNPFIREGPHVPRLPKRAVAESGWETYVLRVAPGAPADFTSKVLWAQLVQSPTDGETEGDGYAVGRFIRLYPLIGQQYAIFRCWVRPLLDVSTTLPITKNPDTEAEQTAFDAALAAETLGCAFTPVIGRTKRGRVYVELGFPASPSQQFLDEVLDGEMSEGGQAV
jgi:hypothetical protein